MEVTRRERYGVQITIWLTLAVALLSVATGIVKIGSNEVSQFVAPFVPEMFQQIAGFTGALTGFLMLASALGMRRGLRAAWYSTVLLLPMTAIQGVMQASDFSYPLVVLSVVAFPLVVRNRRRFDRQIALSTSQLAAGLALVGVQVYATVGAYALRDEFSDIHTPLDALYYAIVTASTVGYGDLTAQTQEGRLFGLSVVVLGTASFALALGTLLGPAIESRFASALGRMTESQLELLENHVIVLGYGRLLTESILDRLGNESEFLVVTRDEQVRTELDDRDINVLDADPSDEETLKRAGIDHARAVIAATSSDADDALAVLTARQLNPEVRIVAGAAEQENVKKLKRAGADTVISPNVIGHLLVRSALGDDEMEGVADRLAGGSGD